MVQASIRIILLELNLLPADTQPSLQSLWSDHQNIYTVNLTTKPASYSSSQDSHTTNKPCNLCNLEKNPYNLDGPSLYTTNGVADEGSL